ncbi:hypothetical protein, partial [Schumannella luteola]
MAGTEGAGGSSSSSTATSDMSLEALLSLVTGVTDSGLAGILSDNEANDRGWVTGTPGGSGRDAWSQNLYYGYYQYEKDIRMYELINNPEPVQAFNEAFAALKANIGKVIADEMPGLSAKRSDTAAALFANFTKVTGQNATDMKQLATALGADDSSIRGSTAAALLAQLESQYKSLERMNESLTDDGGVSAKLTEVANAVRTFMKAVETAWNAHSSEIANTAANAKAAVLSDIYHYIEDADKAYRAEKSGNNGMPEDRAKQAFAAYTWGDRGNMAPAGFSPPGGDLRSTSTYGGINRAISQSVRDVLQKVATDVFTAQQTLETTMRQSLRTFKDMQDPTVAPKDTTPDYNGGDGVGGDGDGPPDGPDWDDIFGDDGPGGDGVGGDGSGGGGDGAGGGPDGDGIFGDGPGGDGVGGGGTGGGGDGVGGGGDGVNGNGDGIFGDGPGGDGVGGAG